MRVNYENLAQLYAKVFAGPPWNEVTKDRSGCGNFFGPSTKPGDPCPVCRTTFLSEAYPKRETADYIRTELLRPRAKLILRQSGILPGQVVGFAWGYAQQTDRLIVAKYRRGTEEKIRALENVGVQPNQEVFYLSECGVLEPKRNRGLGTAMAIALLGYAKQLNLVAVLRTNYDSKAYGIAKRADMQEVDGFPDEENRRRVILIKSP